MVRLLILWLLLPLGVCGQSGVANQVGPGPGRPTKDSVLRLPVPERRQFIKAGVGLPLFQQSSFTLPWKTIGVGVTLERKLKQGLTVVGGLETNFSFGNYVQLYTLELPLGLRYYFPIGKRMKQRADRHSFFSPYVGLQTHNVLFANMRYSNDLGSGLARTAATYYRGQLLTSRTNTGNLNEAFNLLQYGYCLAGAQFRVSTSNYLDVNVALPFPGLVYHKTDYTLASPPYVTIRYGIFW